MNTFKQERTLKVGTVCLEDDAERKITRNLEEEKNQLVNSEKTKILNMHSSAHYNNIRSSVSIKFF